MASTLWVGTRKGLFSFRRDAQGVWRQASVSFLGDNVTLVLVDPRDETVYASLALGHFGAKFRRSRDGGITWTDLTPPTYPADAVLGPAPFVPPDAPRGKTRPAVLQEIWALEPGGADQPGWLWAGTIPGGLFRSTDHGEHWEFIRSLWDEPGRLQWMGGGKDEAGIHSVTVDPRDNRHITVGVSCGGVWQSLDAGESWTCTGEGLRAEYMPPDRQFDPIIQDVHCIVRCSSAPDTFWCQHHNGIFHSVDDARTWRECSDVKPSAFGFAVAVHPRDPRRAWFVPAVKDECRVPVDGHFVVVRTSDGGQTFESFDAGLPPRPAYDLVYRHSLDIDSSGEWLAMGSTTGGLWWSDSQGERWECISAHLPPIHCVRWS